MDIKELGRKNISELRRELAIKRDQLREVRFKLKKDETKDVRETRKIRRSIAQILTILNRKKSLN